MPSRKRKWSSAEVVSLRRVPFPGTANESVSTREDCGAADEDEKALNAEAIVVDHDSVIFVWSVFVFCLSP